MTAPRQAWAIVTKKGILQGDTCELRRKDCIDTHLPYYGEAKVEPVVIITRADYLELTRK